MLFSVEASQALVRDNYRCIVSGKVDTVSLKNSLTTVDVTAGGRITHTQLGHILSESMTDRIDGTTDAAQRKLEWASSAAAVVC